MPVFPDNEYPVISISDNLSVGSSPVKISLLESVSDADNLSAAIVSTVVLLWYCWPGFRRALHGMTFFGRMSLTNYLLQSLLGTALFYNWGLGLYRHVDVIYGTLAGVGIILVQYLFCRLWLRRHTHGPVEWVWKKLTWIDLPLFDRKIAS